MNKLEPQNSKDIIGNTKLIKEFKEWIESSINSPNSPKKAALVSGPMGIGKTLSIELISKELKIKPLIFEPSMCKAKIPATGKEEYDFTYISKIKCDINPFIKRMIIFENGDSLSGTLVKEIITLISNTKIPIIIVCNDSYPLKTLATHCIEFKFRRPTKVQIRKYLQNLKLIKQDANCERVEKMITEQGNDIRHIINSIKFQISGNKDSDGKMDVFKATQNMFDKDLSLNEKMTAYFEDYMMVPLMIQENYIKLRRNLMSHSESLNNLKNISKAADGLCDYDTASTYSGPGNWSLLNLTGILSIRAASLSKIRVGRANFSRMLGKNSARKSNLNKITDILINSGSKMTKISYRLDFIPIYCSIIDNKLQNSELQSDKNEKELMIKNIIIDYFKAYNVSRDDFFDLFKKIELQDCIKLDTKTKSAFTRIYKKI